MFEGMFEIFNEEKQEDNDAEVTYPSSSREASYSSGVPNVFVISIGGSILINGKPVNIPSYQVKKSDVVALKENKKPKGVFKELANELKRKEVPAWLSPH